MSTSFRETTRQSEAPSDRFNPHHHLSVKCNIYTGTYKVNKSVEQISKQKYTELKKNNQKTTQTRQGVEYMSSVVKLFLDSAG